MKTTLLTITALLLSAGTAVAQSSPFGNDASPLAQVTVPTIQTTPTVQTTPTTPKDAGLEFEGFGTPNTGRITDTIYRGECPGESQGSIKARFYSTGKSPAPGQRVVVRNVSRGLVGDTAPFTDRDYSEGRTSESTSVEFGTKHELRHFVVLEGQNNLEYEIRKSDSAVVERGAFTAQISRDERTRNRNAICSDEKYCRGSENTPLDQCENVSTRSRCYCPDKPSDKFIRR